MSVLLTATSAAPVTQSRNAKPQSCLTMTLVCAATCWSQALMLNKHEALAVGVDLVHIPGFSEQLARPGSTFEQVFSPLERRHAQQRKEDRKSTRLNSSHVAISYAVFCLKKKRDGRR